MFYKCDTFR